MILKNIKNIYNKTKGEKEFFPLFDTLEHMESLNRTTFQQNLITQEDFEKALSFLKSYRGSQGTFNAYRRELERFFQWCGRVANKSLNQIKREDIEDFVRFCQKPSKSWIGKNKVPRFIPHDNKRIPNPEWKPFVVTVTKSARTKGEHPDLKNFEFKQGSLKELFAILSSFYNYLLQENYVLMNPVALIRQKSKFIRKQQGPLKIRRLSDVQWKYVINTAQEMAEIDPEKHQRTLFILSILYSMYLRISEISASERWTPMMKHFHRDSKNQWWFTTVGKGNKQRQIAVSNSMLEALKIWRKHLGLSPLPSPSDNSPLLPKIKGPGPITHTTYIRRIVQKCFDKTIEELEKDNLPEEAESLKEVTVHWLRHTGISEDIKHRPREHVRDDAGHSSSAITDKYIDIELNARHETARNKVINE